jgi:hypothetical protein
MRLRPGDLQADQLAHAADLALLAFAQDEAQLVLVLPAHLGRLQDAKLAIEREAVVEQAQAFSSSVPSTRTRYSFSMRVVLADELLGDAAVLGQHEQAGGVDVEAAGRGESLRRCAGLKRQRRLVAGVDWRR